MKPIHYGALLLLGAVWGASFLFIGVAAPEFGPLSLMFARVGPELAGFGALKELANSLYNTYVTRVVGRVISC